MRTDRNNALENRETMDSMRVVKRADKSAFAGTFDIAEAYADHYYQEHLMEQSIYVPEAMAIFAMARLQWITEHGRASLNGEISAKEFMILCSVFSNAIATPHELEYFVTPVADEFGLEPETYQESSMAPFINKLLGFSPLQRLALRDLVQKFWYVEGASFESIEDFLAQHGIEVAQPG